MTSSSQQACIALGHGATCTANNQLVVGQANAVTYVSDSYWGTGVTYSSPNPFTFNATGGAGTDVAGAALKLAGGKSTGAAAGGPLVFLTAPAGSTGTSQNGLVEAMRISSTGGVGIGFTSPAANLGVDG